MTLAFTPKPLSTGVLPSSVSVLYTAPALTTTIVKEIVLTNTNAVSGATRQAFIYFVPSGGSASVANALLYNTSVDTGNPVIVALSTVMATGDTIQGQGSSISCRISGVEGA